MLYHIRGSRGPSAKGEVTPTSPSRVVSAGGESTSLEPGYGGPWGESEKPLTYAPIETKQDYAYRALRELITEGKVLPGQRIVVSRIAAELGVSAIPIREALVRLESERLVTIRPHIGAIVALVTRSMVRETLEALAVVEGYATKLARPRAEKILPRLREAQRRMSAAYEAEDWEEFSASNRAFHFAIYDACENTVLVEAVRQLWAQLDSFLSSAAFNLMPDRAGSSIREHEQLIDLLSRPSSDDLELELLAREHKLNTLRRLTEA